MKVHYTNGECYGMNTKKLLAIFRRVCAYNETKILVHTLNKQTKIEKKEKILGIDVYIIFCRMKDIK